MGQPVSFFYCALLLILYSAAASAALCLHLIRKEVLAVPLTGLFAFFLIDNLIIFMTEQLQGFAGWYNRTFLQSPVIKSVIYLGIAWFSIRAWNALVKKKLSSLQAIAMILLGLWLLFAPLMGKGPLVVWLYYLGYQVFSLTASAYCLYRLRRTGLQDGEGVFRWTWALLVTVIVMSLAIAAEDTYVIFKIDKYSPEPYIYNRNISEDVFRLILICFLCVRLRERLRREPPLPAPEEAAMPEPAEDPSPSSADYNRLKYSHHLGLTRREEEILLLLLDDRNNKQISELLYISLGTVKAHVHNIFQKADVASRSELLRQFDAFSADLSFPSVPSL